MNLKLVMSIAHSFLYLVTIAQMPKLENYITQIPGETFFLWNKGRKKK